jgi:hypothetical protein
MIRDPLRISCRTARAHDGARHVVQYRMWFNKCTVQRACIGLQQACLCSAQCPRAVSALNGIVAEDKLCRFLCKRRVYKKS